VIPLPLPGREGRFSDTIPATVDEIVQDLGEAIRNDLGSPFALLGHSMGGLLAYELARWLRRKQLPEPAHLFVSAFRAPLLPDSRPPIHALPDTALRADLLRLQGTPLEVLHDSELLQVFLPVLRADLRICESYRYRPEAPLSFAITCLSGMHDRRVSRIQMVGWKRHTSGAFRLRLFPGGHFYLFENPEPVLDAVSEDLRNSGTPGVTKLQTRGPAAAG
jgi:surfactin synthase thioesterase subunit